VSTFTLAAAAISGGGKAEHPPTRLLLECQRDREDDVLRFLSDLRIPPTPKQAERDVRPAKTQQKIFGSLRFEQATRHLPKLTVKRPISRASFWCVRGGRLAYRLECSGSSG
jgi:hypothetical protein